MKYLFICGVFSPKNEIYLKKNILGCVMPVTSINFAWNIIKGLKANKIDFEVISLPEIPTYPLHYKKPYVPSFHDIILDDIVYNSIGFYNILGLKDFSVQTQLYRSVKRWIKENKDEPKAILLYNVFAPFMEIGRIIKLEYPDVIVGPIVTDMIEDAEAFQSNRILLKKIQNANYKRQIYRAYPKMDFYVLLSKHMAERIPNACFKNTCVVEGIFDEAFFDNAKEEKSFEKYILYAGSLHEYSNVMALVNAFEKLAHKDYKLVICGDGSLSKEIENRSKLNPRIIYKGMIPRSQVLKLQSKASLLVNPRKPSEIARYSFPSKTMEMLASGVPSLAYRIDGVPDEYYCYLYAINGDTVADFANSIDKVLDTSYDEKLKRAKLSREFLIKEKNAKKQIEKVLNLIDRLGIQ